jgi:hypothetical protein
MTEMQPPAEPQPAAPPPQPAAPPQPPVSQWAAPAPAAAAVRPTGAVVITIIETVLGVLLLLGALAAIGLAGLGGALLGSSNVEGGAVAGGLLAGLGIVFGIILGALGALYLAIAYGVWKARSWSWMLGLVVSIIALVFGILGVSGGVSIGTLLQLALPGAVVYFLWQPDVKRYLGRPA